MKFKNIFFTLFIIGMINTSCSNFLEEVSVNDIDAEGAINDTESAQNALIGIYASLQNSDYYGGRYLLTADAMGGNSSTGGFDDPNLDEIGAREVTSSNPLVQNLWTSIYLTIANCNNLIAGLSQVTDADVAQQIEGEARAIRAMAHFDLLRFFGYHWDNGSPYGIPVVNKLQGVNDVVPRSSVAETYNFILSELTAARDLVDGEDRSVQFVNQATITALLARVNLYKKDLTAAAALASAVIEDGAYSLVEDVTAVYTNRRTTESIFELAFNNQDQSSYNTYTYSRDDAFSTELLFMASSSLNDLFASRPDDSRAALVDFSTDTNDETITSDGSGRTQKYRGEDIQDNPAYILRLAEMYLIRAEALGLNGGLDDLNTLRNQRGLGNIDVANEGEFLQAVSDERIAELNFEGHIYFDLARTGKAATVVGDEFRAVLPIPDKEVNVTNEVIVQNPGY